MNDKFNTIMPETTDRALCVMIDRRMSVEGYRDNFLPRIEEMLARHGEVRLLVYFKNYQGWEEGAAAMDLAATQTIAAKMQKCALVNPPSTVLALNQLRKPITPGETRVFLEEELPQALVWINQD